MNVSLRQLRVFQAVVASGSFSRAGELIGLTQPAVSRAVRELEQALEVRLLDRTTREVVPTLVGRQLYAKLARVLDELQEVLQAARKEGEQAAGTVRVASSPTLSASLMPAIIAACRQQYPQLQVRLHDQVQRLNLAAVRSGEVDFGLVVEPEDDSELELAEVLQDDFWLVCRYDHPLAATATVAWPQLDGAALVLLDAHSGSRRLIDGLLRQHRLQCPVAQELGHSHSVFQMVQAGLGVSVSPGLALPLPAGSQLRLLPLLPRASRRIVLARRRGRSLSPAAERVWQVVLALRQALQALAWGVNQSKEEREA